MIKMALIKPPATYSNWYKKPVLSMSYIASYLEAGEFDCEIFDAYFNDWTEGTLIDRVAAYNPDIVGITSMTHEIAQAAHIAALIKKRLGVPVVVGGCHITALPERTLAEFPAFDYGIYGEGEETVLELLSYLYNEDPAQELRSIRGLVFRDKEDIIDNGPRSLMTSEQLDALPFPSFHHYYGNNTQALKDEHSYYVMISGRGCPYSCAFCMQVLGRKIRRRSAENICKEMEYAIAQYGTHIVSFVDELFLANDNRTREILQLMIETGLSKKIKWSTHTRANIVTPELIALAKQAGCFSISMGVESGDAEILKAIGKGITIEQVKNAVRIVKEAGLSLETYFIIGHPNETRETAQKTIDLAAELNTDRVAVGIMVPYPGTKICDMAKNHEGGYRLLSEDWSEYDKYGGRSLEIKGFPYKEMEKYQARAYINLYLKNYRFIDLFRFFYARRKAFYYFLRKKIGNIVPIYSINNPQGRPESNSSK